MLLYVCEYFVVLLYLLVTAHPATSMIWSINFLVSNLLGVNFVAPRSGHCCANLFFCCCANLSVFQEYNLGVWKHCSLRCIGLQAHVQAHMQVSLHMQFITYAKSYFHFLFCYNIFPVRRTFPNMVHILQEKTFCLNC